MNRSIPDIMDTMHPKVSAAISWKEIAVHALLLALVLVVVFPGFFFRHEVIAPTDLLSITPPWGVSHPGEKGHPKNRLMADVIAFFLPNYAAVQQAFEDDDWPIWNPNQYAGLPLAANMQSSVFYPPRVLLAFFNLATAYSVMLLLKLWLCGMTGYLAARGIGLRRILSRFFAIAWMLSTYCLTWAYWPLTDVVAWLPIAFLGVEYIFLGRFRKGGILLALGGALILLAGHPETAFTSCLGLGGYFLLRYISETARGGPKFMPIITASIAWTIALLVCAVQILPFLEYLKESATFVGRADRSLPIFTYSDLACAWVPRFFGTFNEDNYWGHINTNLNVMLYYGMAVWILLALLPAVWGAKKDENPDELHLFRKRTALMGTVSLFGLLMAYDLPSLEYIHSLPLLNATIHTYHAVFACFALPFIATLVLDRWIDKRPSPFALLGPLGLMGMAVLIVWATYRFHGAIIRMNGMIEYTQRQFITAIILFGIGLAIVALRYLSLPRWVLPGLLTIALAVDLLYIQRGFYPTTSRDTFYPRTALIDYLKTKGSPLRVGFSEGGIPSCFMQPYDFQDWTAYDGLYPGRMWDFQHELGPKIWDSMAAATAIPYYLNNPEYKPVMPEEAYKTMEKVTFLDGMEVLRYPKSLPHARLVGKAEVIEDHKDMFERMSTAAFPPENTVLLEKDPGVPLPDTSGPAGTVTITRYQTTEITMRAVADRPCMLVLADAWYPGWRAAVDGKPTPVHPVYRVFRGVFLDAGAHEITLVYDPDSLRWGLYISMTMLCLLLLGGLIFLRRPRIHKKSSTASRQSAEG